MTRGDLTAGFVVFLIALPLCLGISVASGAPATAGLITAIVGGLLASFIGSAPLTIKGPAAGLIVVVLGAVLDLGGGDPAVGYPRMLAVGVIAGLVQVAFALTRAGVIGELMPTAVVQGMLAAIGVIIASKQVHVLLGVVPSAREPLGLIAEVPHSLATLEPRVFLVGILSLGLVYLLPRWKAARVVPVQLVVLLVAVPLGLALGLGSGQGPYLVRLPASLLAAITFPDFSQAFTPTFLQYVIVFALVGSIETLLSVAAVDRLDPQRRTSNRDRDLLATGASNVVAALLGGLPMISEVVRSKANVDNGATTSWANAVHGALLLGSLLLIPRWLEYIPLAALAAMLIAVGVRLASPREFVHSYRLGPEHLAVLVMTMAVTLATDLLMGVAAGLLLKGVVQIVHGAPVRRLFSAVVEERREGDRLVLVVHDASIFSNWLGLRARLQAIAPDVRHVIVDFEHAWVVDHTVQERLEGLKRTWTGRTLTCIGLEDHEPLSAHPLATRRKPATAFR
jgi:MFS superfamily sulfate permease-like transporter